MTPSPRALTLIEVLVVVAVVSIAGVGVSRLVSHALRLAERAERRSELTMAAHAALERARLAVSRGEAPATEETNGIITVRLTSQPASPPLTAITATASHEHLVDPLEASLTGWAVLPAGGTP